MATSVPQTYSSLRSDLRHQESKTEITLAELSSLTNSGPTQADIQVEDRLLEIFANRRETIDAMARLLDNDPSGGGARVHHVARAREILLEHEKEFRRMKVVAKHSGLIVVCNPANTRPGGVNEEYEPSEVYSATVGY
jgi:hypothetical protein